MKPNFIHPKRILTKILKYNRYVYGFAKRLLDETYGRLCTLTISWVDSQVAIGDITDVTLREGLRLQGVEFIIDTRLHFAESGNPPDMCPLPSVWKFANDILELSEKSKVLLFCHGGIDRSPFIAMLYYKLKHGCDFEEAYKHIQKVRPQCMVHDEWVRLVKDW